MWQQAQWETAVERPGPVPGMASLGFVWAAVVGISVLSPDLVSGSEQEHLPVAAFGTWIWGVVASRSLLTTFLRLDSPALRSQLTAVVGAVWTVATVVSILGPRLVTGTDPTSLPIAAMVAPTAAAVITAAACEMVTVFGSRRG